jgi:hypothetical protein
MIIRDYKTPFGREEPDGKDGNGAAGIQALTGVMPEGMTWRSEAAHNFFFKTPRREPRPLVTRSLTCKSCDTEFEASNRTAKYCGERCRQRASRLRAGAGGPRRRPPEVPLTCAVDGLTFMARNATLAKFCSARCREQAKRNRLKAERKTA